MTGNGGQMKPDQVAEAALLVFDAIEQKIQREVIPDLTKEVQGVVLEARKSLATVEARVPQLVAEAVNRGMASAREDMNRSLLSFGDVRAKTAATEAVRTHVETMHGPTPEAAT